jgi:uncharacterized protein (DUF1501 family)
MEIPNCSNQIAAPNSRREFLRQTGLSMGTLAFGTMLSRGLLTEVRAEGPLNLKARPAPLPAKAKHIIHIFAQGAPSHLDTFDYKPGMKDLAEKSKAGQAGVLFPTPFEFKQCGKSGLAISEIFPKLQGVADELCIIRSMHSDLPAHGPAAKLLHTGSAILTKPSLGSWVLYGLGTESQDLPGFVSLGGQVEARQAAFLPSIYQGAKTTFRTNVPANRVIPNLQSEFTNEDAQRKQLNLVHQLNDQHMQMVQKDEQLEARIESFELAFRMQTAATDAFDISKESQKTRDAYGKTELGAKLLCARRLVERGVRFVQIDAGGWDHHNNIEAAAARTGAAIDGPAAVLINDLKERGLLSSTLVIWGGEFGRTPTTAGRVNPNSGRDHWAKAYCCWMAGGGVKAGINYGETDDIGGEVVSNGVDVHDLHATILRLMGFDHTKLTYRYNGRDFRLTDNYGKVAEGIIA